jgi:hypothetical protein
MNPPLPFLIYFYDWATERLKKAFSKETQRDKEKEVLEERLVYGADKMRALDKQQKQTNEQLKAIHKQLEMLISSDKDDIKADLTKDHHYFCYKKKWIDDYSLDCMQKRFERYVEEGGNSFIEKLMDEVKASLKSARLRNYQGEVPVGARSLTIGSNNRAAGEDSFAEGKATYAVGNFCHAEGNGTTAGFKNTATGKTTYAAHAEGGNTQALGMYSHAQGYNTIARADMSHCEGFGGEAKGTASHVEGLGTISHASYQHVQGKYNIEDVENKYAHIVGGGTGSSENQRKNIYTLDWQGNAVYAGDVTITVGNEQIPLSSDKDDIKADLTKDHHYFCYKKKWIDDYSLDCMQKRFERYVEEGGNSFIEKLMDEVKDLPNQPPSGLDS